MLALTSNFSTTITPNGRPTSRRNPRKTNKNIDLFEKVATERKTTTKLTYNKSISIVVIPTAVI